MIIPQQLRTTTCAVVESQPIVVHEAPTTAATTDECRSSRCPTSSTDVSVARLPTWWLIANDYDNLDACTSTLPPTSQQQQQQQQQRQCGTNDPHQFHRDKSLLDEENNNSNDNHRAKKHRASPAITILGDRTNRHQVRRVKNQKKIVSSSASFPQSKASMASSCTTTTTINTTKTTATGPVRPAPPRHDLVVRRGAGRDERLRNEEERRRKHRVFGPATATATIKGDKNLEQKENDTADYFVPSLPAATPPPPSKNNVGVLSSGRRRHRIELRKSRRLGHAKEDLGGSIIAADDDGCGACKTEDVVAPYREKNAELHLSSFEEGVLSIIHDHQRDSRSASHPNRSPQPLLAGRRLQSFSSTQTIALEASGFQRQQKSRVDRVTSNTTVTSREANKRIRNKIGALQPDLIRTLTDKRNRHRLYNSTKFDDISVTEEIADALMGSVAAYTIAELRELARKGLLKTNDEESAKRVLDLPISRDKVIETMMTNMDSLQDTVGFELYLDSEERLASFLGLPYDPPRHAEPTASMSSMRSSLTLNIQRESAISVVVFDDERSSKELVYGISVNRRRKLIRVFFRGSVTTKDWIVDAKTYIRQIPNPVDLMFVHEEMTVPQHSKIGIQRGFYSYLNGRGPKGKSKYDQILENVRNLLQEYPGYAITCCGHSLGGALASLFAFQLASSTEPCIPKPITCISFGSPRVGNVHFSRAFQELEMQGLLRHLRVANKNDLVTMLPNRVGGTTLFRNGAVYKHVGMQMILPSTTKQTYTNKIAYQHICHSRAALYLEDLSGIFVMPFTWSKRGYIESHGCSKYLDRLERAADDIKNLTLNQLYAEYRGIVYLVADESSSSSSSSSGIQKSKEEVGSMLTNGRTIYSS